MTGSRRAIVAPIAGTTRDSLARPVTWRGASFQLFDTGGLYGASKDPLHELVVKQGQRAIEGADLVVIVVDGREGLVGGDETIARELRETGKPLLMAVNKTDDKRARDSSMEFYQLGIDPVLEISAEHGTRAAEPSRWSAWLARRRRLAMRTSWCWSSTPAPAPPIRTRRLAAKPIAPAAAS